MTDIFEQPTRRAGRHRKQRRKRTVRTLVAVVVGLALVAAAAVWAYPTVKDMFASSPEDYSGPGSGEVLVEIPSGASGTDIGDILLDAGVVASTEAFTAAFNDNPDSASIQAGTYRLMEEMKASDAVSALLDSANRAEVTITVPEGFYASQIYERIATTFDIPQEDVEAAAADTEAIGLPEEAGGQIEGWLAPATYPFAPSATATEILAAMVAQTVSNLEEAGVASDQWQTVLTKASIVEREGLPEYYAQIARVIDNRLADTSGATNGYLQMDATVNYGLGKSGGVPTEAELAEDTPYNTYLHAGLPPTPIGSPSLEAIEAVLNPAEGDWIYFTTVNLDTGETKFASTLAEHQQNVEELKQWRQDHPDETTATEDQ